MNEKKIIADTMTKLLDIASTYFDCYLDVYHIHILTDEEIELLDDEEEKTIAIDLKQTDDFLEGAKNLVEDYKKEKNLDIQIEDEDEESI